MNPQAPPSQALPDVIPLNQAHLYFTQPAVKPITDLPQEALPSEIPINEAHNYFSPVPLPATIPLADAHIYFGMNADSQATPQNASSGQSAPANQSYDKGSIQDAIAQATAAAFGPGEVQPMLSIVKSESNFNPTAQNSHSSAYGLAQFLDSTWKGTGIAKTSDPSAQTQAMLTYVKQRYGSPAAALRFRNQHGWY